MALRLPNQQCYFKTLQPTLELLGGVLRLENQHWGPLLQESKRLEYKKRFNNLQNVENSNVMQKLFFPLIKSGHFEAWEKALDKRLMGVQNTKGNLGKAGASPVLFCAQRINTAHLHFSLHLKQRTGGSLF
jgi:hypothetical protein